MKKILSILLITALLIQSTGYLCIVGMFKLNQDYIAKNICINRFDLIPVCLGSCYLEDQMNAQEEQQNTPDFKNAESFFFCEQLVNSNEINYPVAQGYDYPGYVDQYFPSGYIHNIFHPPTV